MTSFTWMQRRFSAIIVIVALIAGGCFGDSAEHHANAKIPPHGLSWGDVDGRVVTLPCGNTAAGVCIHPPYLGKLRFCPAGDSFGPCTQARVDETGRFHIRLRTMMWRVTPKPDRENLVTVHSKRFVIGGGQHLTIRLYGSVG